MQTNIALLAVVTAFLSTSAYASDCVKIDNDLDRLACYDRESGRTPVSESNAIATGKWQVSTEKSEFRDTTDVYLLAFSEEAIQCRNYGSPGKLELMIRCQENTTTLYVGGSHCHVADHNGYDLVEYRIDDQKSKSRRFDASTDSQVLGLWNGRRSIPVVKELLGHNRLLVRFAPFGQSALTASFDIRGLDDAIVPLREACHW